MNIEKRKAEGSVGRPPQHQMNEKTFNWKRFKCHRINICDPKEFNFEKARNDDDGNSSNIFIRER